MEQLGQTFKEARIQSGKTIEDAVRETKIARKYLIAIENEDFDIFPGETYLVGFLRNYAQFLGLDPDEMVIKYRDYKIQEQPAPIEQLTARPKTVRRSFLFIFVILMILAATIYIIFGGRKEKEVAVKEKLEKEEVTQVEKERAAIIFEEEDITQDFKKGDVIEISHKNKSYTVSIDDIDENLNFSIGSIPFSLSTDERVEIDFDRDGRKDLLIRTNVLGEGIVNLTLKRLYKTTASESEISVSKDTSAPVIESSPPEVVIIKESDLISKELLAPKTGFKIVSGYDKVDIKTHLRANATAYIGYIIDEQEKKELLLHSGDELDLSAKDVLRITAANAKGVEVRINNIPVILGESGQVVAKVIRWYRDNEDTDLYHLIIDDWEK